MFTKADKDKDKDKVKDTDKVKDVEKQPDASSGKDEDATLGVDNKGGECQCQHLRPWFRVKITVF